MVFFMDCLILEFHEKYMMLSKINVTIPKINETVFSEPFEILKVMSGLWKQQTAPLEPRTNRQRETVVTFIKYESVWT